MKFIISVLLIALLALAMGLYLPWWSIALAAFIVSILIHQSPTLSFLTGFLSIFLLWLLMAFFINTANEGILAARIARVLPLGGSVTALIFVTAMVGAIVGGMAALTGALLRKIR